VGADPTNAGGDITVSGDVSWIEDGDTIEVETGQGTLVVRLVAVNAPDRGECYADSGLDHLIDTLRGRTVGLEVMGEDQFGRTLAHVFDGDRHVNLELVIMGLTLASTPDGGDPHRSAILGAEQTAYEEGAGLWSADACGSEGPVPEVAIVPGRSVIDPAGPDEENMGGETLVIENEGAEAVDLTGWILRDESTRHRFTFPPGVMIDPGQGLEVASSDTAWEPGDSPVWNNSGDMALLQLPDGTIVARWRYSN
jgi:endonuclease YncB( thermonuclease family)